MPMIRMLGRRWNFASDDLVVIGFVDGIWRIPLVLILLISLVVSASTQLLTDDANLNGTKTGSTNASNSQLRMVGIILLLVQSFIVINLFTISYFATKGSVLNVQRRLAASSLFSWRFVCLAPLEQVANALAIVGMARNPQSSLVPSLAVVVAVSIAGVVGSFSLGAVTFDSVSIVKWDMRADWMMWMWNIRLTCASMICCRDMVPRDDKRKALFAFESAAESLCRMFGGHYDLVASDLLAGLLLTAAKQKASKHIRLRELSPHVAPQQWMTLANARHFYHHALAIYSWPLYVFLRESKYGSLKWMCAQYMRSETKNMSKFRSRLLRRRASRCLRDEIDTSNPTYGGRSFNDMDLTAFRRLLPDEECELCYLDLENQLFRTPFAIVADHTQRAVVVTIRGTLSLSDLMTDLCAASCDFHENGLSGSCHKGMLEAAVQIVRELDRDNILARAMADHQNYQLVICGHSLGAGTAALVTLMLRSSAKYSDTIGFAFSPPSILSETLAIACEPFVYSITVGIDMVARLSFHTFSGLIDTIIDNLVDCRLSKYGLFYNVFMERNIFERASNDDNDSESIRALRGLRKLDILMSEPLPAAEPLYLPGIILHLTELDNESLDRIDFQTTNHSNRSRKVVGQLKHREEFQSLIVSSAMFKHHMPDLLLDYLFRCDEEVEL